VPACPPVAHASSLVSRIRFGILPALASKACSIGMGNPSLSYDVCSQDAPAAARDPRPAASFPELGLGRLLVAC